MVVRLPVPVSGYRPRGSRGPAGPPEGPGLDPLTRDLCSPPYSTRYTTGTVPWYSSSSNFRDVRMATFVTFLALGLLEQHTATLSRRAVLPSALAFAAAPGLARAVQTPPPTLDQIKVLGAKAKVLRATVRSSSGNRRLLPLDPTPGFNNYASVTNMVVRAQASVLVPLQAAMTTFAAMPAGLPDNVQKQLATQALLLKGHLLELNDALGKYQFDEYVSKTTKMTYSGGKVERELEEVCDTVDDYVALARGEAVEQRED